MNPGRTRREARRPFRGALVISHENMYHLMVTQTIRVRGRGCEVVRILETGCILKVGPTEFAEG